MAARTTGLRSARFPLAEQLWWWGGREGREKGRDRSWWGEAEKFERGCQACVRVWAEPPRNEGRRGEWNERKGKGRLERERAIETNTTTATLQHCARALGITFGAQSLLSNVLNLHGKCFHTPNNIRINSWLPLGAFQGARILFFTTGKMSRGHFLYPARLKETRASSRAIPFGRPIRMDGTQSFS